MEAAILKFRPRQPEQDDRVDVLRDITGLEGSRVYVTLEASGLSDRSKDIYRRAITRFEAWNGELEPMDDEEFDALLTKYAYKLHKDGLAPKTNRLATTAIRFFVKRWYRFAGPWPLLDDAYMNINRDGRTRGRAQRDGLTWEDVELLAQVSHSYGRKNRNAYRDAAMVRVMSDAGLRASELVNVQVEHITFNEDGSGSLLVPYAKNDQAGEGHVRMLGAPTVEALRAWLDLIPPITEGHVFISVGGKGTGQAMSVQACRNAIKALAKLAGIDGNIGSHSLRIGSAQELVRRGATISQVQQVFGWKDRRMVEIYTRNEKAERNAIAVLKYGR